MKEDVKPVLLIKPVLLEVKSEEQHITELREVEEKGAIGGTKERSKIAMRMEKMGLNLTRR